MGLLEWGRIQDCVRLVRIYVNFEQFATIHHPLSPQLMTSFIEVFAALINLIGFVILSSVILGVIACVTMKLMLDFTLGCVAILFNLHRFFCTLVLLMSIKGVFLYLLSIRNGVAVELIPEA